MVLNRNRYGLQAIQLHIVWHIEVSRQDDPPHIHPNSSYPQLPNSFFFQPLLNKSDKVKGLLLQSKFA